MRLEVLVWLNDLAPYRDRALMLRHAAERVGRMVLLTGRPSPGGDLALPPSAALEIVPVARRHLRRPALELLIWRDVRRRLRAKRFDLLHDNAGYMMPLFADLRLRDRDRPALLTSTFASTYDWFRVLRKGPRSRWWGRERRYWQALVNEQIMARLADGVTVFGEGHRRPFAETYRVPVERIFSLPNCVDPALFHPVPPARDATGFEPGARVLLFVGSIFSYKGYFDLIRAFARVHRRHPRARLLFLGTSPPGEAEAVRREPAVRGVADKVRLAGPVPRDRLPGLLAAAYGFVLPSYAEGSPRVAIEAMACGRPVVGTRIPGIQALDPDERFIYFADRGDVDQLAAALDHLLGDPDEARRRGEAARERFLRHHTPEAAAAVLADLYRHLAAGRG